MPAVDRPRREGAGARGATHAAEQLENLVGEQQDATAARAATALEKLRRKHEIAAARENKQAQLTAKARERAEHKTEAKRLAKEQEEAKAAEKDETKGDTHECCTAEPARSSTYASKRRAYSV